MIYIYSDASGQLGDNLSIGVGLVAIRPSASPSKVLYSEEYNLGESQIVYNGELEGVTRGIEYASSIASKGTIFRIFSDNQASLLRLKTPSDNPG